MKQILSVMFLLAPEDCTFDDGYCSNFTMYTVPDGSPRRWLLDTDTTSTVNTGPPAPKQGIFNLH